MAFANALCCEDETWEMLVAGDGSLLTLEEGKVFLQRPGTRSVRISTRTALARDLAVRGGTVYWSEEDTAGPVVAKSVTLEGVAGSDEPHLLAPTGLRKPRSPCATAKGRTVAASPRVRVYAERGSGSRYACRLGRRLRRVSIGRAGARATRVVGDRWVLVTGPQQARVLDTVRRRWVAKLDTPIVELTLLRNGTLAWIDDGGRVLAKRPGDASHVELGTGGSALASGGSTVYWTAGGEPQRAVP